MLEREFPSFFIHKTRYPRSVYFAPETPGQARYLRVDFKGHKGEVDLAFKNIPATALRQRTTQMENLPGQIVSNGKSSAIQVAGLEPFVISDGFGIIETKVRAAYQAAHALLTFWSTNRASFDALASAPQVTPVPTRGDRPAPARGVAAAVSEPRRSIFARLFTPRIPSES
jgi:hypothetical protein